jgi:hypothetical protein
MTILEEKIRKNRELYDAHEPVDGHSARFAQKLDDNFHQGSAKKSVVLIVARYAAGVLLIATVATILLFQYSDNSSVAKADGNDELTKMMAYYDMMANQKLNEISSCTESDEEAIKVNEMANQQLQVLEEDASELKEKLDKGESDERVYSALVNNYRTRIKILDNIINNICQL